MTSTNDDDPVKTLGEVLQRGRSHAGLSVRALSEQAGVSVGQLSKLENDQVKKVNPAHLAAIAGPLELPLARLYAAAGYDLTDLAPLEPELVQRLMELSPDALNSITKMLNDLVTSGQLTGGGPVLALDIVQVATDATGDAPE